MQRAWVAKIMALLLAGSSAGCSLGGMGGGESPQLGSLAAGPAPNDTALAAPAPEHVAMGGFLEGPVGSKLAEADREAAFKAESQAVSAGERRTWRGSKGVYGFVVPAASGPPGPDASASAGGDRPAGECRAFTHTIYFSGRPQTGRGTGCRDADGTWRIAS